MEFKDCVRIPRTDKLRRIYEDNDFIIDLMKDEDGIPELRVSIFNKDGHFLDEEFIRLKDYLS